MGPISSPGIGSGIDVQAIVTQLVALERAPLTQLKTQATSIQTKLSTYGTIKSQVSALGDAASKLASSSGWNAVIGTSSNPTSVGVTAAAGAPATSLTMAVQQLAKAQSTASTAVPTGSAVGSGSMTIELGTWNAASTTSGSGTPLIGTTSGPTFTVGSSTPVSVTINAGEDTLTEIAAKINEADAGVSAIVLKDASGERLLMRSRETGVEYGFRISVADADGNNTDGTGLSRLAFDAGNASGMTQTQASQNALATINGVAIETASNRLTDTVPGLTLQLAQVTTEPVEIDVSTDVESITANIKAFVDAYNTLNTSIASATRYDSGSKTAGALQGDATATGLQNALRSMMRSVSGSTTFTRLSDVGIELQTGGALSIDSEKMDTALGDLNSLKQLFMIDTGVASTEGFGHKVKTFTDGLIATDGLIGNKTTALQASITRNSLEQEKVNDRAARAELRYLAQYNAMDANVARLNSLNTFISQQITLWNNA